MALVQNYWHGLELFLPNDTNLLFVKAKHPSSLFMMLGVPQDTVLSPLLFLIYINDLPNNLHSNMKPFAHGALLYGVITSDIDYDHVQEDLCKLEEWQNLW